MNNRQEVYDLMKENVLSYGRYTITDRAIPSLEDGLKNIHRRILWSMNLDKLSHDKARTKSINASGSVLRFSPHGDSSVYDAMVRLANDSVNYQLVDGKGAFSSHTSRDVQAGSPRYTESRLSKISKELLDNINKNAVDMSLNYDDTKEEPTVLPSKFPLILINQNSGIAMGISSDIASFNMRDVFNNTRNILEGKPTFAMYPDFSTGGYVEKNEDIAEQIKKTGKGSFTLRAKYEIDSEDNIIITEIPYSTTRESVEETIMKLYKKGEFQEIQSINDISGKDGLGIEIVTKKNSDNQLLMQKLYKRTPLQSNFPCQFYVLYKNKPHMLGTDAILERWINFRIETIRRVAEFELQGSNDKLHLMEGLMILLSDVEKAVEIVKNSDNEKKAIADLMNGFDITECQAQSVADLKIRNLNKGYLKNKVKDLDELKKKISKLEKLLKSDSAVKKMIVTELNNIEKEYGKDRLTEVSEFENVDIPNNNEPEDYNVRVFVTKENYIKKIPLTSLRGDYNIKLKHEDEIISETNTTNTEEVLIFTDKQNVYKKRLYELPDSKPSDLGQFLPNLIELEQSESILAVLPLNNEHSSILIGFEDGKVAKITNDAYRTKNNRSVLRSAYADKTALLFRTISEDVDLMAVSTDTKSVLMNTEKFTAKGTKKTQGNAFIKLREGQKVDRYIINPDFEDKEYYRIQNAGVGKNNRGEI